MKIADFRNLSGLSILLVLFSVNAATAGTIDSGSSVIFDSSSSQLNIPFSGWSSYQYYDFGSSPGSIFDSGIFQMGQDPGSFLGMENTYYNYVGYQQVLAVESNSGFQSTPNPDLSLSTDQQVVPEPSTIYLIGGVLIGLGVSAMLRRRRSAPVPVELSE